ncbi:MAG: YkgJ family cysteine cluster protein, partial [Thermoplasmatota archaeon]
VKELYQMVSSEIDCTKCANCCRIVSPELDEEDIIRLSESLRMPEDLFREEYLVKENDPHLLYFKDVPCPFLDGDLCSHYDARPKDCREFPHLHKGISNGRRLGMIDNSSLCPIVFNVLEMLKEEVWHRGRNYY